MYEDMPFIFLRPRIWEYKGFYAKKLSAPQFLKNIFIDYMRSIANQLDMSQNCKHKKLQGYSKFRNNSYNFKGFQIWLIFVNPTLQKSRLILSTLDNGTNPYCEAKSYNLLCKEYAEANKEKCNTIIYIINKGVSKFVG